ncbi:hypothetical protein JK167_12025 [Levilactobacillus brevis]|uniref:Uncharacterized protein n=1 Tax=Levilactobacillus brevis TaxID=1580 RepID=A0AA41ERI5_LEVBR|nr:hypothetical protein [Levilactobacillus brevis]MBS0948454.1 hypothetical protein [Levilactobacillus brevis]MBS1011549.1 hypothetical protein [Levilactobacillus brevis]
MATPNVGILTTAGKALIDKVNSGQAKISFSKVVFSSMDNSQLSDTQAKALTAIVPQEVVVSSPETTLDTNSGETRIRATGTNKQLADGVYVKTYGVFAKDETGNEVLYGVTVSPNPNYFPAYDGVTPQAVTYSYKTVIQETSNITMTNSNDVYVSQEDLTEAIDKIPQPDLSNYATKDQLATKADTSATEKNVADMNTELSGGLFFNTDLNTLNSPFAGGAYYYQVLVGGWDRIRQVAYLDLHASQIATRVSPDGGATWTAWVSLANTDDVATAISTATANMADTTKPTNFTNGLQSGGVDVATAADLKSIEESTWHILKLDSSNSEVYVNGSMLYKIDTENKIFQAVFNGYTSPTKQLDKELEFVDLSSLIDRVTSLSLQYVLNTFDASTILDYEINGAQITTTTSYKLHLRNSGDVMLSTPPADGKLYVEIGYNELNKKENL